MNARTAKPDGTQWINPRIRRKPLCRNALRLFVNLDAIHCNARKTGNAKTQKMLYKVLLAFSIGGESYW